MTAPKAFPPVPPELLARLEEGRLAQGLAEVNPHHSHKPKYSTVKL
jgi:hypothetical protein